MQSCNVRDGMAFVQHNQLKQQYKSISMQRKIYMFEKYIMYQKSPNFFCVEQRSVNKFCAIIEKITTLTHTFIKESKTFSTVSCTLVC